MPDRVLPRARRPAPGLTANEGVGLACDRFLNRRDNRATTYEEPLMCLFKVPRPSSQQETQRGSPTWHEEALRETAARYDAGNEPPIDWDAAKRELRKRAE